MYKNIIIYSLVFLLRLLHINNYVYSQDLEAEFEEFKNAINNDYSKTLLENQQEYSDYIDSLNNDFYLFLENSDKEFCDFLKNEWKEFDLYKQKYRDISTEPSTQLQYDNSLRTDSLIIQNLFPKSILHNNSPLLNSSIYDNGYDDTTLDTVIFNFFGEWVKMPYDPILKSLSINEITNKTVSDYWLAISKISYSLTLKELKQIKDKLNLNDWAYLKIILLFANNVYPDDKNKQNLLGWFLGNKSGYNINIGIDANDIYLLFSSENLIYERPGFELNGIKFYVLEGSPASIKTYSANYNYGKRINLSFSMPLLLPSAPHSRQIAFKFSGEVFRFNVLSNKNLIDFYKDYPQTELHVYHNSFLTEIARESLIDQLAPLLENKSVKTKIELLLAFVQQNSIYQSDIEHFGREKYFFPEESIFYEKSDCEDRTLLLSFLLKEFLNTETIGLDFKGHIVLGIPDSVYASAGSKIVFNQNSFLLVDPAYLNAPVGVVYPELLENEPEIIELEIEKDFNLFGLNRTDGLIIEDYYSIGNNRYVFCGYVFDTITLKDKIVAPGVNTQLVVGITNDGTIENIVSSNSLGDTYAYKIINDVNGNFFVLGSFNKNLNINGEVLESKSEDFFVLKLDSILDLKKLTCLKINPLLSDAYYFNAVIDSNGELVFSNKDVLLKQSDRYEICIDNFGNCVVSGILKKEMILSTDTLRFETGRDYNIVDWLIQENKRLLSFNLHPEITPLLAVLNFIITSQQPIKGYTINETFAQDSSHEAKIINKYFDQVNNVKSLNNAQDFILLKTLNSKALEIENFRFSDYSRFKVYTEPNDIRLFIYSGVSLEKSELKYKVNYFLINKYTAELQYDYDQHYRKTIPARYIKN